MRMNGKEYEFRMNGKRYHCALDITMTYIGGKWKTVVLWYLRKDRKRFGELKKLIPSITEKMLSIQLRQLERDGFIGRKVYAVVPPRVEYFLTPHGKTLMPVVEAIAAWGRIKGETEGEMIEVRSTHNTKMRPPKN